MSKFTVVVCDGPYGKQRFYSAMRFVLALLFEEHDVRLFLFEDAVHAAKSGQNPQELPADKDSRMPNAEVMMREAIKNGAKVMACGACCMERGLKKKMLSTALRWRQFLILSNGPTGRIRSLTSKDMGYLYSDDFLQHLENPLNVGVVENPDGDGLARSLNDLCGDVVRITISVKDDRIAEIKFKVYGCASAIAGGSIATEIAKGKTLDEAEQIDVQLLAEKLGGVPVNKKRCLGTVVRALKAAIEQSRIKTKTI